MDWTEVKIYTTHAGIEPVTALLLGIGVTGIVVEDSDDFADFLESETPHWDYVDESLDYLRACETNLTIYLPTNSQGADQFAALTQELRLLSQQEGAEEYGRLAVETANVNEDDWANNWKKYFKPMPVGKKLLIKPTWESLDGVDTTDRIILEIDPSASFGTGTHYTTRLCMELLEETVHGRESILDMGCGSGILGIAALLLGAKDVTAVDIDENSVRIARENFEQNHFHSDRLRTFCGDINSNMELRNTLCAERYAIITANIVADVILAMLPALKQLLEREGKLLLSGIITEREAEIIAAVQAQGMVVQKRIEDGDWVALLCTEE